MFVWSAYCSVTFFGGCCWGGAGREGGGATTPSHQPPPPLQKMAASSSAAAIAGAADIAAIAIDSDEEYDIGNDSDDPGDLLDPETRRLVDLCIGDSDSDDNTSSSVSVLKRVALPYGAVSGFFSPKTSRSASSRLPVRRLVRRGLVRIIPLGLRRISESLILHPFNAAPLQWQAWTPHP